ncbi:peptide ABC transporter substrate-binding protein [Brevibacillus reuszeri]|uniref:Peptide ABC transporter substrate-binding protein n=1 Tax=Brevibacillus reuszeri TaxID=54915 RepID=A0ABQ0TI11_9BACL|nr:ABC transporter substrate-binding protein [Brevibacillus reuszeri]MED1857193.1 ABC transporter substrate-binding protein [Brevibacillus reuszeri]GED66984.1 peptide ABC transporter substrate-binding protein [Brevibacillus reuszeri]
MEIRSTNKWIKHTAISLIAAALLAGCSSSQGQSTNASGQPNQADSSAGGEQGGEFTYALATSPDTLDAGASGFAVSHRVFRNIFDSLVFQAKDGTFQPWLASSWTKSEDGKEYTFKLRKDVKFQDGTAFNAAAVKANFDHIFAGGRGQSRSLLGTFSSAEVVDEHTIKIILSEPFEPLLSGLSSAFLGISSPKAFEQYKDQYGKHPVGSGPFKFVSWTENDQIVLERNPDYNWGPPGANNKGPSQLSKITFKIIPEEATRIGSVQSGQALAAEAVPPQLITSLQNDPNITVDQSITNGTAFSLYINTKSEPWSELKARQAVQLAVDVDTIVRTLYLGTYERAWSALTPGILGYDSSLENKLKPDIAKANQLLDELGWKLGTDGIREKDGKKLVLRYLDGSPNREKRNDIAAIVQQQLKQIGIQVNLNITKDTNTPITNGEYDIFGNSQVKADPDILRNLFRSDRVFTKGGTNWSNIAEPEIDQLLDQGAKESDPQKRKEIYEEIQRYMIDNAIILPIYVFPYTVAHSKKVEGLQFDLLGYPLFYDVTIHQ